MIYEVSIKLKRAKLFRDYSIQDVQTPEWDYDPEDPNWEPPCEVTFPDWDITGGPLDRPDRMPSGCMSTAWYALTVSTSD